MLSFIKEHPLWTPVGVIGAFLAVLAYANDAYTLVTLSLPTELWVGIGAALFFISLSAIVIKQQHTIHKASQNNSAAPSTEPFPETPDQVSWNEAARLTLVFDNEIHNATAINQDNVHFYYWHHIPGINVDLEKKVVREIPGNIVVFLALKYPTHNGYKHIAVLGGGISCETLASHSAAVVVRANGNMAGRTLDIRMSKTPIPLG